MSFDYRGISINITSFYGGCDAKLYPPEDSYPGEPAEMEWEWDAGSDELNELLDLLLENNEPMMDLIEESLFEQVVQDAKEARDEAAISRYEDSLDRDY